MESGKQTWKLPDKASSMAQVGKQNVAEKLSTIGMLEKSMHVKKYNPYWIVLYSYY
jgi:hypothetical protein